MMEFPIENREYEFDASQNSLILDLSKKMRFVAYVLMGLGLIEGIGGVIILSTGNAENGVGSIIAGIVYIVIGIWTQQAAKSFRLIVDTEGRDIENMMGALGQLRKLYSLQYWVLMIALVFVALGVVLAFFGGALS